MTHPKTEEALVSKQIDAEYYPDAARGQRPRSSWQLVDNRIRRLFEARRERDEEACHGELLLLAQEVQLLAASIAPTPHQVGRRGQTLA